MPLKMTPEQATIDTRPTAICLMGPTASGKTNLAIQLLKNFPFEIISVDSAQIYRGMDIGTGKPDARTLATSPHHLIDIVDPNQAYSAADFRLDAIREMQCIQAKGKIPLLVGGTMMYFKVLRDGLAAMPAANQKVRREIEDLAREQGWQAVHEQLRRVDPQAAQRIHPNDPQRLQRALEVYLVSGKTLTQLHKESNDEASNEGASRQQPCSFNLHFIALQPQERSSLHHRIAARFHQMLEQGLVDEVEQLVARGDLVAQMPSMRCVGYRQVWQHLRRELSYDAMIEKSIIATRQLAKRQFTWLRSWGKLQSFDSESLNLEEQVLKFLQLITI